MSMSSIHVFDGGVIPDSETSGGSSSNANIKNLIMRDFVLNIGGETVPSKILCDYNSPQQSSPYYAPVSIEDMAQWTHDGFVMQVRLESQPSIAANLGFLARVSISHDSIEDEVTNAKVFTYERLDDHRIKFNILNFDKVTDEVTSIDYLRLSGMDEFTLDSSIDMTVEDILSKIPSTATASNKLVTEQQLENATASMASGYTPKGPASVSTLNGLTEKENGDQYIVTNSGTLTDGSLSVIAGESVAWDSVNEEWYKVNQYALKRFGTNEVKNLPTTATESDLNAGSYTVVDTPEGPKKLPGDTIAPRSSLALKVDKEDFNLVAEVIRSPNVVDPTKWMDDTRCVWNDSMANGSPFDDVKYNFLGKFNAGDVLVFKGMITGYGAISYGKTICGGTFRQTNENYYETSDDGFPMYTYTVTQLDSIGFWVEKSSSYYSYVALKSEYDKTHRCLNYGEAITTFKASVSTNNIDDKAVTADKIESQISSKIHELLKRDEVALEWVDGYYWGTGKWGHQSFSISNPIELHSGESIYYYGRFATTGGNFAVQIDRNEHFIRSLMEAPNGYAEFRYTATLDKEYISFSKNRSSTDSICYVFKNADNEKRIAEEQLSKNDYYKHLFENVTCIGDSLTEGYYADRVIRKNKSYPAYLAKITGWNVENLGSSGATPTSWYNNHQSADFSSTDAVFVCLGTNEGLPDTYGQSLGDHTDYYCRIIDKILSDNPNCKIFLFTVQGASVVGTITTNETIKKIADGYSSNNVAFCDWKNNPYYYMSGQSGGNSNLEYHPSTIEGTHFGKIGYLTMARVFLSLSMAWIDSHKSNYELPY